MSSTAIDASIATPVSKPHRGKPEEAELLIAGTLRMATYSLVDDMETERL
ncbi:MAG: hypothetical protein ACQETX_07520 [Pseudomonadota bacterium]